MTERRSCRRPQVEGAERPATVVMTDIDPEYVLELAAADDQQPVEALAADADHPALYVRVRVRRLHRSADDLDLLGRQEGVEGTRELRVAVVDQEPHLPVAVVELHQQVARLLQHPSPVRLVGAGEILDPAAADREEDEHVEAAQPDGVDGEEVAGEDRLTVRAQEAAPRLPVALRRRRQPGLSKDVANRSRGNREAELAQLADDPQIAPAR